MTLTELIHELERIRDAHGDLEVLIRDNEWNCYDPLTSKADVEVKVLARRRDASNLNSAYDPQRIPVNARNVGSFVVLSGS